MNIEFQNPLDQFNGGNRLIDWLESHFDDTDNFNIFVGVSAFSKSSPFWKLSAAISSWHELRSHQSTFIFGIDHQGTSKEALSLSLNLFNNSYVVHTRNSTFHPKIYFFEGEDKVEVYFGSSNMTIGGLETNFESGVFISLDKSNSSDELQIYALKKILDDLLDGSKYPVKIISSNLIEELEALSLVTSEKKMGYKPGIYLSSTDEDNFEYSDPGKIDSIFGSHKPKKARKPNKPISSVKNNDKNSFESEDSDDQTSENIAPIFVGQEIVGKLLIEVIPHHNGEVFLSVRAVNKNPDFFGLPFTGASTPTKAFSYPSRDPKPNVTLNVYDSLNNLEYSFPNHSLTMVYYKRKSDFRITVPAELRNLIYRSDNADEPKLLEIIKTTNSENEYILNFYRKGNSYYKNYLDNLEKTTIPSGGKKGVQRTYRWEI
ncbi:hypothetical protein FKY77_06260 [Enterococcus faecium]|uniref:phospholipase D family protein n=1 Tax=Enterococcus TaxID=1350 RepID=UPI000DE858BE|nr:MULTISPECIES: phospholipase D family protein [Enterococcus]MCA6744778.1 phospholipase D family protein [Enterococcus lactis]NTR69943.1 hypothetical protein [Enterococcus faecium]NTR85630.1 hypothetical protein [Enterococcus faecium]NTS04125.1 hypothetical protein [Enterococcus faecium]RBT09956.1 hypothetical protein EA87_00277 [Enterococcus faecium]